MGARLPRRASDRKVPASLAASTGRARLLGQGPHRAAKLEAAAAECKQLQQLVGRELAGLKDLLDERTAQ